ncbi:probable protein phosphatase 2C 7 [Lolium rigidum]|uniref:probable protein phosphatase 2C 7 n=1 Tax=Lolium rigidum TaxID=89674 RepID=UPI001F5CF69E|nr:probable protein phosphatase 2C 7 [Lolium rigidum]
MVPDGDQEVSTSSSTAAAAIARATLPPRPVSFKRTAVWHQMKHRRFRGGTKKMAVASSPAQAVGEATTAAAAMRAPTESERDDEKGHVWGSWKSEDGSMHCGYSSYRGRRQTMEDFYDIKASKTDAKRINVFGVFDGHGGSCAAKYLKDHLFENLLKHPAFITDTKLAISESYKETDADFLAAETTICRDSGSTASTAIFVGNHLYVANVGDSRAVISKAGKAIALSDDHKPDRSDERERIENAGGVVTFSGTWRVGGVLAMSRAFGDRLLKQFVVAEPEIQEQEIDDELEFLILASDGLWDVVPNEHAVAFVKEVVGPEAAARKLTEIAYRRGSRDNITCIVVEFHRDSVGIGSPPLSGQI